MKKNNPDNLVNPVKINEVSYKHRRWPRASSLIIEETFSSQVTPAAQPDLRVF
jgi:hypothetical protein